ncbi:hypothetical protein ABOM_005628 [Aspergillus bombycis]|uniref:Fumarylacetoacetase-like C-terminal domain-containing protein n=1 Tax=Aspergillus bombycis TaxID=109264 RepID=A0A1F8A1R9_9EURO|nr:hypothetical protein ABOM_005628 [Aspergillus bombycis]OGM45379.1 hypothetical protein ABOM_005628 [Aspergillus bombycis]
MVVSTFMRNPSDGLQASGAEAKVTKVPCPLEFTSIILCIGLNYKKHAKEGNVEISPYPVVFTKPADALTGPYDNVDVHPDASSRLNYEGELVVVIGKDGKNLLEKEALDYVLSYTVGNDISARNFQHSNVGSSQFYYAKSFGRFAPIGPAIHTTKEVPDPQTLSFVTRVGGEKRQIIAHLSRGTTLRKGIVFMTGTPSGVGLFISVGFFAITVWWKWSSRRWPT